MTTEVKTTVPGNIWKVLVKEGDNVKTVSYTHLRSPRDRTRYRMPSSA